jgi:hypothetical protein
VLGTLRSDANVVLTVADVGENRSCAKHHAAPLVCVWRREVPASSGGG